MDTRHDIERSNRETFDFFRQVESPYCSTTMAACAAALTYRTSPRRCHRSPHTIHDTHTLQVLAIGSKLIVLGEVGEDPEGAAGDVVLRKAAPNSILDLKTTSISRPFVVSTETEQGLLQVRTRNAPGYKSDVGVHMYEYICIFMHVRSVRDSLSANLRASRQ